MFGKRSATAPAEIEPVLPPVGAPPPAEAGADIATRPQRLDIQPKYDPAVPPEAARAGAGPAPAKAGPRHTAGFEQLRAAADGGKAPTENAVAEIVREQSDYYHATKTTIYTALLNTIDLSQLASLDAKTAAEEIRDIVAELVAIKNVSMSVAEQEHLVQDIVNDVLGYGPLEPLLARDDIADIMVNGSRPRLHRGRRQGAADQRPLPRQYAADEHLPADRQPGRPPRRRIQPICDARLPDGSRVNVIALAAGHRRPDADDPKVQEGQADDEEPGGVRLHQSRGRARPRRHRRQRDATC